LGDISYPLYIVHYPVMYLFYAWLIKNELYSLDATWPVVLMVFAINITLAYICLKLYDEPVRRWLAKKFINKKK
jgi:peptidoglycan/LPS O-acetylase OafA/YrhL